MRRENAQKSIAVSAVKRIFRKLFKELFGGHSLHIIELRLKRELKTDPYKVLYENPGRFCKALRKVFGEGFDLLFKTSAQRLIEEYSLNELDNSELAAISMDDEKAGQKFLELLIESSKRIAEKIIYGSKLLNYRDKDGIVELIELAKMNGGVEEEVFGDLGWAVKVAGVMVFGIEFRDEKIPIAMYNRKYARFRQIAEKWIEETSRLFRSVKAR